VGPLAGVRILDLTRDVAGPYATKLFADFGADVIKVEAPGGDPSRQFGPFYGDDVHPEKSGLFLHLNTNKRSVVLDVETPEGAEAVRKLARTAHVVFEDFAPGEPDALGIGWDVLSAGRDDLVLCSITPFGQSGPYRDMRGSEITLEAMGGPMLLNGHIDREPLKLGGHNAYYHAGVAAAFAAMLARFRVERGGPGDHIDLAVYECQAGCRDRRTIYLTAAAYTGATAKRGGTDIRMGYGVRECQDGHVIVVAAGNRVPMLLAWIGREDLIANEDLYKPNAFIPEELVAEVEDSWHEYLMRTPKVEAIARAQELGILGGAVLTPEDLLKDAHYRGRGAWDTIDHPETGPIEYPGRPMILSASPRPEPRRAPLLGEHNADLERDDPWRAETAPPRPPADPSAAPISSHSAERPLEGVRVLGITVVWAGPHVTQLLGEWGADVIRVEPTSRIQTSSRGADQTLTQEQARVAAARGQLLGAYPDFDPKEDRWNRSPAFNSHSRNKKSMACDITTPEGKEAFLKLVAVSDVLVENNVPETIEKAGITWDDLKQVNPRLVMLRMPGFGLEGPYKNYRVFGMHAEAMIGHHYLRGYTDASPAYTGSSLSADGNAGVMGAFAVVMALRHRDRTGEGQQIEMPLAEAFLPNIGEFILDYTMNGRVAPPQGNTHPHHAPHNVYATAGDDQWIAIDVGTDEEFVALCSVLDASRLTTDVRFATAAARLEHRGDLDGELAPLIAPREKEALFRELQAAGVVAAPLHDELEVLADEQLAARDWFREIEMPTVGTHRYPGYLFKMRNTPDDVRLPPPLLGEHNEEVYLDILGYERDEYEALIEKGLVGTTYPPEVLP
jgi:crotonobetainyl-CoA:carnitine CoA-transferase CaiB-like acyl-CoA transferase